MIMFNNHYLNITHLKILNEIIMFLTTFEKHTEVSTQPTKKPTSRPIERPTSRPSAQPTSWPADRPTIITFKIF